jgi:hypothetical protein
LTPEGTFEGAVTTKPLKWIWLTTGTFKSKQGAHELLELLEELLLEELPLEELLLEELPLGELPLEELLLRELRDELLISDDEFGELCELKELRLLSEFPLDEELVLTEELLLEEAGMTLIS